jgi:hypothetical protein
MRVLKIPLEAKEEKDFLRELKKLPRKFITRKMNGQGFRSWPDRLVMGEYGFTMLIEIKRKIVGKLSPGQEDFFPLLGDMGHQVSVFDDGKEAAAHVWGAFQKHCEVTEVPV